jgi:hypothetical protein
MNEIYKLKLHQETFTDDGIYILRVPGGWIYGIGNNNVFVPYNNEFMETEEKEEGEPPTPASGISESLKKIENSIFILAHMQHDLENLIREQNDLLQKCD